MAPLAIAERSAVGGDRQRAVKRLAQSLFAELRNQGYTPGQIVGLSSELIGLITSDIAAAANGDCGAMTAHSEP